MTQDMTFGLDDFGSQGSSLPSPHLSTVRALQRDQFMSFPELVTIGATAVMSQGGSLTSFPTGLRNEATATATATATSNREFVSFPTLLPASLPSVGSLGATATATATATSDAEFVSFPTLLPASLPSVAGVLFREGFSLVALTPTPTEAQWAEASIFAQGVCMIPCLSRALFI